MGLITDGSQSGILLPQDVSHPSQHLFFVYTKQVMLVLCNLWGYASLETELLSARFKIFSNFFGWFAHNFGLFWEDNFLHLIFWHQWQNVKGNLTSSNQQQSIAITQVMKLQVVDKMMFLKVPLSFVHTLAQEPQRRPYPVQHRQYCPFLGKALTFCLIFITLGRLFTPPRRRYSSTQYWHYKCY